MDNPSVWVVLQDVGLPFEPDHRIEAVFETEEAARAYAIRTGTGSILEEGDLPTNWKVEEHEVSYG